MPIKGEQQGYIYKALINGEWQEVTIQESPLELVERFEQDEEWTRVRHGHWIKSEDADDGYCSVCKCDMPMYKEDWEWKYSETPYCPYCGAKMDEEEK